MQHFWIITLQANTPAGLTTNTIDGTRNRKRGQTREQMFREVLAEAKRAWHETAPFTEPVAVLFFSLEPNGT